MRHYMLPFAAAACATILTASPALPADSDTGTITSGRLAQNPDEYYGNHVRVRGEVARVYDRRSFTLDEDHPFVRHDLLVIAPRPLVRVRAGAEVVITGYVRRLDSAELRRDYKWFEDAVPDEALDGDGGRPVLVAESIVMRSLGGDRDDRDLDRDRDDDRVEKRSSRVEKSESRFTLRDEEDWEAAGFVAGRSVVLSDARVEERLGRHTFVVRDDDEREIVVRMDRARMIPSEGDRVDISGVVRRVPTDIDTWDLDSDNARRRVRAKSLFVEARRIAR